MQKYFKFTLRQMHSLLRMHLQQSWDEMLGSRGQMGNIFFIVTFSLIINNQLLLIFALPRETTSHQVVNQHSQSKWIAFGWVESISQRFYRHVEWTSNQILIFEYLIVLKTISKTKIAQLECPIFDQDIGRFDVPMHNAILGEVSAGQTDFIGSLGPIKIFFVVDERL